MMICSKALALAVIVLALVCSCSASSLQVGKASSIQKTGLSVTSLSAVFGALANAKPLTTSGANLEVALKIVTNTGSNLGARVFWDGDAASPDLRVEIFYCNDGSGFCSPLQGYSLGNVNWALSGTFTLQRSSTSTYINGVYVYDWVYNWPVVVNGNTYTLSTTIRNPASSGQSIKLMGSVAETISDCANLSWNNYVYATNITANGQSIANTAFSFVDLQDPEHSYPCANDYGIDSTSIRYKV